MSRAGQAVFTGISGQADAALFFLLTLCIIASLLGVIEAALSSDPTLARGGF
jgi:hypothetical protein